QENPLILLLAKPARLEQRDGRSAVLARHRARPQIGNCLLPLDRGIEPLQVLPSLLEHPPSPGPDVPGEVHIRWWEEPPLILSQLLLNLFLGEPPRTLEERLHELGRLNRELWHGSHLAGELLGVFQGAFEDEPGDRVDVNGGRLASQAHGFQRDRPATRERVEHTRSPPTVSLLDLLAEPVHVGAVLVPPVQDTPLRLFLDNLDRFAADLLLLDLVDDLPANLFQQLLPLFRCSRIKQ